MLMSSVVTRNEEQDMSRLQPLDHAALDPAQHEVADAIVHGPRGRLSSLFEVWLRNPELCDRVRRLGDYARWDASAPRDLAELAVLVTAAHFATWPEFDAHARFAEDSGIGADFIATVRDGRRPEFDDARHAAVHDLVAEYFATYRVAGSTYATALDAIGEAALVDVVAIAGYYAMVCMTVNVFEITG
jgi:4-carboxymuconolactone decarboxylase